MFSISRSSCTTTEFALKPACGHEFKVVDDPKEFIGPLPVEKHRMCSFRITIAGQHVAILTGFTNTQIVVTVYVLDKYFGAMSVSA